MLFNIINETLLADQIKSIIKFLCRPIVSIDDNKNKKETPDFYKIYKEDDFNKFSEEMIELVKKQKKRIKKKN